MSATRKSSKSSEFKKNLPTILIVVGALVALLGFFGVFSQGLLSGILLAAAGFGLMPSGKKLPQVADLSLAVLIALAFLGLLAFFAVIILISINPPPGGAF